MARDVYLVVTMKRVTDKGDNRDVIYSNKKLETERYLKPFSMKSRQLIRSKILYRDCK